MIGRRLFYGLSWLLVAAAFFTVPMPFFTLAPGSAIDVNGLLEVDGEVTELQGSAALLAVTIASPSIFSLLSARFDDEVEIASRERILPTGVDDRTYFDDQADVFNDALTVSAAVAMQAAGLDVQISSLPVVVQVIPGSPADGVLAGGDLVTEFNGVAVATADDLVTEARKLGAGDLARLTVLRGEATLDVELVVDLVAGMTRPGMGITIDTSPRDVVLPQEVRLKDDVRIGGPSAGLMFAITVYDLVAQEDLLGGRLVAGTGTLELDGRVGRIGSIQQKVHAAQNQGYTIFLAPASQADEAREVADDDLLVIPVETFEDALVALRAAPDAV